MTDLMRVRIKIEDIQFWRMSVTDIDTGKFIPVLWDAQHGIELRIEQGCIIARVDLFVTELDMEAIMPACMRPNIADADDSEGDTHSGNH